MPEVTAMQSPAKKRFDVLGTTPPRADAYEKVTGRARYTADMHLPDMLYGGGKSAGIPSGKITAIDATRARAIPGCSLRADPGGCEKARLLQFAPLYHRPAPLLRRYRRPGRGGVPRPGAAGAGRHHRRI